MSLLTSRSVWRPPASRVPLQVWHAGVLFASLVFACLLMLILWPGLATNDSGHRLCLADALLRGAGPGQPSPRVGLGNSAGNRAGANVEPLPDSIYQHVFPPMMSMVAAGFRGLSGTWGAMTFVQVWWFLCSLGLLAQRVLGGRNGTACWLALCLVPLVWNNATAMLPDAWVAASLCTMLWCLLVMGDEALGRRAALALAVGFSLASIVFLGFRHNSVTALPVLLLACAGLWVMSRAARGLRLDRPDDGRVQRACACACAGSLALALLVAQALPSFVPWRRADVPATIMLWEHVGALRLSNDQTIRKRHALDQVANAAGAKDPSTATTRAIALHDWVFFNTIVYGPNAPLPARAVRDDGRLARDSFWQLVREEPLLYARAKVNIWVTVLGLRHAGPVLFIRESGPDWTKAYGIDLSLSSPLSHTSSPANPSLSQRVLDIGDQATLATLALWMPYTWIAYACLALCFAFWRRTRHNIAISLPGLLLIACGFAYYLGFFVLCPAFEWRYFLPSFLLLVLGGSALLQRPIAGYRRKGSTLLL